MATDCLATIGLPALTSLRARQLRAKAKGSLALEFYDQWITLWFKLKLRSLVTCELWNDTLLVTSDFSPSYRQTVRIAYTFQYSRLPLQIEMSALSIPFSDQNQCNLPHLDS